MSYVLFAVSFLSVIACDQPNQIASDNDSDIAALEKQIEQLLGKQEAEEPLHSCTVEIIEVEEAIKKAKTEIDKAPEPSATTVEVGGLSNAGEVTKGKTAVETAAKTLNGDRNRFVDWADGIEHDELGAVRDAIVGLDACVGAYKKRNGQLTDLNEDAEPAELIFECEPKHLCD